MTYYADLTRYEYWDDVVTDDALNIGWLDGQHPYPTGDTSIEFQTRLLMFCKGVVNGTRGWHECEFCPAKPYDPMAENDLDPLGTAEIRVFHKGRIYAAPNLIYHYVAEHHYRPPEEFIDAVLNAPIPSSSEYEQLITTLDIDYWFDEQE